MSWGRDYGLSSTGGAHDLVSASHADVSSETGTGAVVRAGSPTFTTQIETPKVTNDGPVLFVDVAQAGSNGTVSILNSESGYVCNVLIDGDLQVSGVSLLLGTLVVGGTVNGRDIAADGAILDTLGLHESHMAWSTFGPNGILFDVNGIGSQSPKNVVSKSGAYTANMSDDLIVCTAAMTLTLPPAATCQGMGLSVKNASSGTVTIDGDGAETIDGDATFDMTLEDEVVDVISDGSNWWISP